MKIMKDQATPHGRKVTLELAPGEQLVVVRQAAHYRLGVQMDDIVTGDVLSEAVEVFWNMHEQKWSEA